MNVPDGIDLARLDKQGSLGAGVAKTTLQDWWIAPCDGTILAAVCSASGIAGTTPKISVYVNGSEVTDEHTIAAAETAYLMAFSHGQDIHHLSKGDVVSMRCETQAGAGQLTNPNVAMVFEPGVGIQRNSLFAKFHKLGACGAGKDEVVDWWVAPCDCRIDGIWCIGTGTAGATDPTINLVNGSTDVATTAKDIAADDTVYEITPDQDQRIVSRGDILKMHVTTLAGTGEMTEPCMVVHLTPLEQVPNRWLVDKLNVPDSALGAGVRHTTIQDLLSLPFDAWLVGLQALETGKAGVTAEKAYIDMVGDAGCVNLDTVFEAHIAGYDGRNLSMKTANDAVSAKSELDMSTVTTNIDTVVEAAAAGVAGDDWKVTVVGGAAAKAGLAFEDTVNKVLVCVMQLATSDVSDFEALVTASANLAVKTGGTGATVIQAADVSYDSALSGGADACTISISGNVLTIHYENAVTTVTQVEAAMAALAGDNDIIDTKTGGTGGNVLTTTDDLVSTAVNLDHGIDGNPTLTLNNGSSEVPALPKTISADDPVLDVSLLKGGVDRHPILQSTILSMRATTLPATGEMEDPILMLHLEY